MSDHAYEQRERQIFHSDLTAVDRASLSDRKESCALFTEIMREQPDLVAERIGWLLDGNYGYGAMQAAKEVLKHKRMNRRAWLTHTIGALEWRCPQRMAIEGWKKLTAAEKKALDRAVDRAIESAEKSD
jgi:hypothetical protein